MPPWCPAAPGDPGHNGGRWQVHKVSAPRGYAAALAAGDLDSNGVLDSADDVNAALRGRSAEDVEDLLLDAVGVDLVLEEA